MIYDSEHDNSLAFKLSDLEKRRAVKQDENSDTNKAFSL